MMSVFPFIDDGLELRDIENLLIESGLGKPAYYEWRSRSGCYFCFYQRKQEWIGLAAKHSDLFEKAISYEEKKDFQDTSSSKLYSWSHGESLRDLFKRKDQIKEFNAPKSKSSLLMDLLDDSDEEDDMCFSCHL